MFESDEYVQQRQETVEQLQKQQQQMMEGLMREAAENGFTLRMTPSGIGLLPTKDGKPMQEPEYLALSAEEKKRLEESRGELEKKVEATLRDGKKLEREIAEKLEVAETRAADYLVRIPLTDLKDKYRDYPKVLAYLDAVHDHILKNLQRFKGVEPAPMMTPMGPMTIGEPPGDPFLPYRVNVFVDNSDTQGPPIIVETNPTYHNLIGVIEKKPIAGGYFTDFTLIKAGSISRANGGYLVLYDRDVLSNSGVWEALQRVIKNRELRIEEPGTFFGFVPPQGLRPEPIPTDTKVIMIGDPQLVSNIGFRWIPISARLSKSKPISTLKSTGPKKILPLWLVSSATTAIAKDCGISIRKPWRASSSSAPERLKTRINSRRALARWSIY